jgi:hypothetical protein
MIPTKSNIQISNSAAFKTSTAKVVSSPYILKLLRDGIYSDKILATIRETISNSFDAHVAADKSQTPIEVYLPNALEPVFRVVDYGIGLDDYGVREVFFSYGNPGTSYKVESNDYLGAFSVGAKAPWCYTPVFQVIATKDGVRRTYNAYINEEEVGDVAQLSEEYVEAPNGVEVQIPVKSHDFHVFAQKLALFLRFNTRPINIHGQYTKYNDEWLIRGQKWGVIKGDSNSFLVMGGVPYQLSSAMIREDKLNYSERTVLQNGLVIFADIGEVTVAASRESVSYTDQTTDFIVSICRVVLEEAKNAITDAFAKADTQYKAQELHWQYFSSHGRMSNIFKVLSSEGFKPVDANGKEVCFNHFNVNGREVELRRGRRSWVESARLNTCSTLVPYPFKHIYVNIGEFKESRARKQLRKHLLENAMRESYLLQFPTEDELNAWVKEVGFEKPIINLSSIILPKAIRVGNKGPRNTDNARVYEDGRWVSEDIDLSLGGVYVHRRYNNFDFRAGSLSDNTYSIVQCIDFLTEEMDFDQPVYTLTDKVIEKLDKTIWKSLYEITEEFAKEYFEDNKPVITWANVTYGTLYSSLYKELSDHPMFAGLSTVKSRCNFVDYSQIRHIYNINYSYLKEADINEYKEIIRKIEQKYPLTSVSYIKESVEYVKMIDAKNENNS